MQVYLDLEKDSIDWIKHVLNEDEVKLPIIVYGELRLIDENKVTQHSYHSFYLLSIPNHKFNKAGFQWAKQALADKSHSFLSYGTHPFANSLSQIESNAGKYPCMWIYVQDTKPTDNKSSKHVLEKLDD